MFCGVGEVSVVSDSLVTTHHVSELFVKQNDDFPVEKKSKGGDELETVFWAFLLIADELRGEILWRPRSCGDLGLHKIPARNSSTIKRYDQKKISNHPLKKKGLL